MVLQRFSAIELPSHVAGSYWIYILQSADGALYIGQTSNLPERIRKHRLGLGSKYTRDHRGIGLVYVEGPLDPETAVAREAQVKRWSRAKKEALIRGDHNRLRKLSQSRS